MDQAEREHYCITASAVCGGPEVHAKNSQPPSALAAGTIDAGAKRSARVTTREAMAAAYSSLSSWMGFSRPALTPRISESQFTTCVTVPELPAMSAVPL